MLGGFAIRTRFFLPVASQKSNQKSSSSELRTVRLKRTEHDKNTVKICFICTVARGTLKLNSSRRTEYAPPPDSGLATDAGRIR